ncbi:MAG: IscS subfamily cysteine desulfurase [Candidatus Dadabacteria bacterium]|nr:MAG: IscS subfamily cysteine desulfurase [Candidatus Dadabacteria bacterium]
MSGFGGRDGARGRYVYMDYQATTPVDPRVLEAMLPYFCERFGNPASRTHRAGWEAAEAVQAARERIAATIGARPKEIVFTSGATESDNLAIKGVVSFYRDRGSHVVTVRTEHKAVLDCCRALERAGLAEVTYLKVGRDGLVDPEDVRRAITERTVLVSVMHANNEIGVIQPIEEIGRITREAGVLLHCDAAQSLGKIPIDVDRMQVDLMSLSAHKVYGPKGIGALFVRSREPRVRLTPLIDGGGHERGMRSGTLNVPGIVGFGEACRIAQEELEAEAARLLELRERLRNRLLAELDGVFVNGDVERRLPGNLNVSFAHVEAESLLMGLKDIALSSGSACTSASLEPSHVLRAIGLDDDLAHGSVRFGLGRYTTREEVDYVAERVIAEVRRLRRLSPLYGASAAGQRPPSRR